MQNNLQQIKNPEIMRKWFLLGVCALAAAGIYSILPFILRSPAISKIINLENFFATSLILHVNLSVFVWFLAFQMIFINMLTKKDNLIGDTCFYGALLGVIILIIAPIFPESVAYKNNYIPVLYNPLFFIGLSVFSVSVFINLLCAIFNRNFDQNNIINIGIYISGIITIIAFTCFIITYFILPSSLSHNDPHQYYEILFWAGGHILQFSFTQIMLVSWLWLYNLAGFSYNQNNKFLLFTLAIALFLVIPMPLMFQIYQDPTSPQFINLFTIHMKYAGGIASSFLTFYILYNLIKKIFSKQNLITNKLALTTLLISMFVFNFGGVVGMMIHEINVTIPAHYHGSIIGITLALMGLSYIIAPSLSFNKLLPVRKLSFYQLIIYAIGQLTHIIGLIWLGGYGALRKTPGKELAGDTKIAFIIFLIGGSLALIGGLLYVINILCNRPLRKLDF